MLAMPVRNIEHIPILSRQSNTNDAVDGRYHGHWAIDPGASVSRVACSLNGPAVGDENKL
jgi:hypothetical protein